MGATMFFEIVGGTLIAVHGEAAPSDPEWNAFADAALTRGDLKASIAFTEGGGPNAKQRQKLHGVTVPTAVVTDSIAARGIVTAISWFRRDQIRAFTPRELDAAFTFLRIPASERDALVRAIATMKARLAGGESLDPLNASQGTPGEIAALMDNVVTQRLSKIAQQLEAARAKGSRKPS